MYRVYRAHRAYSVLGFTGSVCFVLLGLWGLGFMQEDSRHC